MNVFIDFHHTDLLHSLQLLFEKRLGYNLFRPIGVEWYTEGFWNVYPHLDTAKQYLQLTDARSADGTQILNEATRTNLEQMGTYTIPDKHNNTYHKAITLNRFKEIDIDIVIASIPQHIPLFKKLIQEYKPNAKLIVQMGNMFHEYMNNLHEIPNLMASTIPFSVPPTCNAVFYHQEFDTDVFKPTLEAPQRLITSFINVYPNNGGYADYAALKSMMPDYEFKSYGASTDDGVIDTTTQMASIMNKSYFGFHSKRMGDGFGHILYNWFACGKPVITRLSDYKGKLGEELLADGETCINLDACSFDEVRDKIINIPPEKYQWMCQQVHDRFKRCVNYDHEENKIRNFLHNLK